MRILAILMIFVASLFFSGIIGRTKSLASGRKGPGLLQPLKDMLRLLKKGSVFSTTTSIIFQIAPAIYFAALIAAVLVIPFDTHRGLVSFNGDFIFFAYALAMGKFMMIIAALDTGSSFEGMGANREALYSLLTEPVFFILLATFAMMTGHYSFHGIYTEIDFNSNLAWLIGLLAGYLLVQIAMIENSRMPVDDPKTHLELTMIHEVMVLDYSGVDLAIIQYATSLKFAIYGALIANFFIPPALSLWGKMVVFLGIQIGFAVIVGLLESFRARFRISHNPQFILSLSAIAVLVFFSVLLYLI